MHFTFFFHAQPLFITEVFFIGKIFVFRFTMREFDFRDGTLPEQLNFRQTVRMLVNGPAASHPIFQSTRRFFKQWRTSPVVPSIDIIIKHDVLSPFTELYA
jgi:hypothetical protein